jgi:hypothetical protein
VRRGVPTSALVVVGATPYAALAWREAVRQSAGVSTRVRLEAARDAPAPPRTPKPNGRPRPQGMRRPTLAPLVAAPTTPWQLVNMAPWDGQHARRVHRPAATAVWSHAGLPPVPMRWVLRREPARQGAPQAWLSTQLALDPVQLLTWCVQRWQIETTGEEARAPSGLDTSRQWRDRRVARTTPTWRGLYSLMTLMAAHLIRDKHVPVRTAAWYRTQPATVSDTIALVRRCLWRPEHFSTSGANADVVKVPRSLDERLTDALGYAA